MPFVSGFLTVRERGHPGNELPGAEGPTDPGYGISSDRPDQGLPPPPPGIWPPPSLGNPIVPVDPGFGGGAVVTYPASRSLASRHGLTRGCREASQSLTRGCRLVVRVLTRACRVAAVDIPTRGCRPRHFGCCATVLRWDGVTFLSTPRWKSACRCRRHRHLKAK
jgi:hypothetical protein